MPPVLRLSPNHLVFSLRTCAYLFGVSLLAGTVGYVLIEGYTFGEAIYMAIITISTVGFSEVKALSAAGRAFTSVYVIANLAITALFVSQLTQHLADGGILTKLRNALMERQIATLTDHVIVCGAGRYGQEIVEQLLDSEEDIVLVDRDADLLDELTARYAGVYSVDGDATNEDTLERAGLLRAKSVIITVGNDSDNALTVLTARELSQSIVIIARVYALENRSKLLKVGTDHVVQPEQLGAFMMATLVRKPSAVEFFTELARGPSARVGFEEVAYESLPAELRDQSLLEMNLRRLTGVSIVALRHGDEQYQVNPSPDTRVAAGMSLIALGDRSQLGKLRALLGE